MKYNFETARMRRNVGSLKWNQMLVNDKAINQDIVPLSVADMEFLSAPAIIEEMKSTAEYGMWGYSAPTSDYYDAIKRWFKKYHNWTIATKSVVLTSGVVQGIYSAIRCFTEPNDNVIIQTPVYYPFYDAIRLNGRNVLENPLKLINGQYEMDFEDLEQRVKTAKAMILCSPHNPVGRVWTRDELERVAEICLQNGVFIISDEIHSDIVLPEYEQIPFATLDKKYLESSIIATSASKTFSLAGMMCANFIVSNKNLRNKFISQVKIDGCCTYSLFGMNAVAAAYTKCDEWYEELIKVLKDNYNFFKDFMTEYFPKVWVSQLQGTYLVWADFSSFGMTGLEREKFLQDKAGLWLDSGYIFGEKGESFERFNIACPRKILENSLNRLLKASKEAGII